MREKIREILKKILPKGEFEVLVPERDNFGHYSTNLAMKLAKIEKKNPLDLAREIASKIQIQAPGVFDKVEAMPPGFINFWISRKALAREFESTLSKNFGKANLGKSKRVIFEYSDPNIAKRMHVGHLRATIIGNTLANIYEFLGYKVVRWNYIGDWGTQFGKMIAAYKLWGDRKKIEKNPIEELQKLYVRFHKEIEGNSELEKQGQEEFRKLEAGDKGNRKLWEWFRRVSLKDFERVYKILNTKFDVVLGEAFYEKDVKKVATDLVKKGIAKKSEGSLVIPLDSFSLPPALIQKSDGASLYMTRDIPNISYRLKKYKPVKIFYVVGNEQSLHFEQLFKVAEILGFKGAELRHIKYGLVLGEDGKKLSTREGTAVLLEDLIDKIVGLAKVAVEKKNPKLSSREKEKISEAVGVGALKYNDLKENRHSDIVFDWERMVSFSGNSGPYLQYTFARMSSILSKSANHKMRDAKQKPDFKQLEKKEELDLMRKVLEFPEAVREAHDSLLTSNFCNYLYDLCGLANKFYETTPILSDEDDLRRKTRLKLIEQVNFVLGRGLELLGIEALEKI